ncbi:unnamed protein product [Cyprideis torosa]|uniref:Uncharacterized protein n=1 Tax=Cyprideis torosa TaxID=163714 RepID=A0A7R8ZQW2_9CRUS|nr:unnamed protein product [Cyprideis torosa]CAG0902331.1 unnamed protein product [Cyprideis torosa]
MHNYSTAVPNPESDFLNLVVTMWFRLLLWWFYSWFRWLFGTSTPALSSSPDAAFSNAGQKQEPGQLAAFTLTRHAGSPHVLLQTGEQDPMLLPLVSWQDFTLYESRGFFAWQLIIVPPEISFLLSPDPSLSPRYVPRLGATAHGSHTFGHGKLEERITVLYNEFRDLEAQMSWLHVFSLLPGYHPVVKLLLDQGADPNSVITPHKQTPLHLAATPETAKVLLKNKAQVNVKDKEGQTPLLLATALDRHSIAEVLLAHGADPNILDSYKLTPLHVAIELGLHSHLEILLAHGADVLAVDMFGKTPIAKAKSKEMILTVIERTKDLNRQDHQTGNTLLHSSCQHENEEAVKRLMEKRARLDLMNNEGQTALDIALAKGYGRIASLFPGHLQSPLGSTGRFEREFEVVKDEKNKDGLLGEGAFGRVFKAKRRGTDEVFAIKEIHFPPEDAEKTLREVRAAMELSRTSHLLLTHHDSWIEDRRTSDERTASTQYGDETAGVLPSTPGTTGDTDPRKTTIEERESSQLPSPTAAEGSNNGTRLPQGNHQNNQSQEESSEEEEWNESPSCSDEESDDGIEFANSGEETEINNRSQQHETCGEGGSSSAEESDDGVIFEDTDGIYIDHDESNDGYESNGNSSSFQEGSDDGIRFEETGKEEADLNNQSQLEIEESGRNS